MSILTLLTADSTIFGASFLPDIGLGLDLSLLGYREDEYLFSGEADLYRHDDGWQSTISRSGIPFTTRVVVRSPTLPEAFSGTVHIEPLHPDGDGALTWRALYPYLLRKGHAHVGVNVSTGIAALLRDIIDPRRYASLTLAEDDGLSYDIFSQLVRTLRTPSESEQIFGRPVERLYVSGWSMTAAFCRVFMNEGFHGRARKPDGSPCVDGAVLAIASGARPFGYPALSKGSPVVPVGHPRRKVQPAGVPIIELLSEFESEGNALTWRPDSDEPHDRYRLYQVAGSSHSSGPPSPPGVVAAEQLERAGIRRPHREIIEQPTDARLDFVARAVFELLEKWPELYAPPHAEPLQRLDDRDAGPRGLTEEAFPLERDEFGNAVGGLRTTWVDVPIASYYPHSTPRSDIYEVSPLSPLQDPASAADLVGHRRVLSPQRLTALYGNPDNYAAAVSRRALELVGQHWLLAEEVEEIIAQAQTVNW